MTNTHFDATRALTLTVLAATLVVALSACGQKDSKPAATQVAARVGSEEISVHQINQVLQRSNTAGANPEAVKKLSHDVLEKLIDQQLAVDQATEAKLNRTPDVVAQIEAARRDILARAYMQQIASAQPKPTAEETQKYFTDHPQLFTARRIYNLHEIVIAKTASTPSTLATQLRADLAAGKTTEDLAAGLKAQNIAFNGGAVTRAAEQVPLELLSQLHPLKDGESLVLDEPQTITLVRVVGSQSAPVDAAAAQPRIAQYLANQRASEAVAAELKRLRSTTAITYMGEFSAPGSATTAAQNQQQNPVLAPVNAAQTAIEKGIAGLK